MKKLLYITFLLIASMQLYSQTDGLSYQALIIGPDDQELPGVDAQGNILPNTIIAIRFTIYDEANSIEFQEEANQGNVVREAEQAKARDSVQVLRILRTDHSPGVPRVPNTQYRH